MRKIEVVCPHCAKTKTIETAGSAMNVMLKCAHCLKSWDENFSETGILAKSAPSGEFAKLRENLAELGRVVDAYVANPIR